MTVYPTAAVDIRQRAALSVQLPLARNEPMFVFRAIDYRTSPQSVRSECPSKRGRSRRTANESDRTIPNDPVHHVVAPR